MMTNDDDDDIVRRLALLAVALALTTLLQASWFEGYPLDRLGTHASGYHFWSWIYHSIRTPAKAGTFGYDPVQGCWPPLLRLQLHVSAQLCLWAAGTWWWTMTSTSNSTADVLWPVGGTVVMVYATLGHVMAHRNGRVSFPGGPRPHKIQRQPQWNSPAAIPPFDGTGWKYLCGAAAHAATAARFAGTCAQLTGEPAGRDIWVYHNKDAAAPGPYKDDLMVQQLACGGRYEHIMALDPSVNPNSGDQVLRAQQIAASRDGGTPLPNMPDATTSSSSSSDIDDALRRAVHFYSLLQTDDGHWTGDYGGPHFLMPGLIVVWYVMGRPALMLNPHETAAMTHYLLTHQQADGGWGTHIESPSTMFGTTLCYVALRLLGLPADQAALQHGRTFVRDQGGALYTSSWAKFYLCLLGCMEWDGHNSVPPELWLLPNWCPFHPGRMWCHARMVYLPMGYLYGHRYVYQDAAHDPLIAELRQELYVQDYQSIAWHRTRHWVADLDNYAPIPWTMAVAQNLLSCYERWWIFQPFKRLVRRRGLAFCRDYMAAEDLQTNFIDIGPVNKVLNMLSAFHAVGHDVRSWTVVNHMARVADYLWVAEDGMKMKGYNGSQCWDTSFAIQAIHEADLLDDFPEVAKKGWSYLERCQILSTNVSQATEAYQYEQASYRRQYYRNISKGGWPFSTSAHGWPITDCTGEGLKGVLCLLKSLTVRQAIKDGTLRPIELPRQHDAINVLLSYQNEDGGFATYENMRGFGWYESLNPSEVFGDIMIDYSYVECSMATLTALVEFHAEHPQHRAGEIQHAIDKGRDFLKSIQRTDGSWYGSWACCFCYGCWFGVEGLVKCGEPKDSETIRKACDFLLKHQRPNGGWGEDFTSCYDKDYAENGMEAYGDDGSGVVNTGWALLALAAAQCSDTEAIRNGVSYLIKRQLPCGDWPQEGIAGVFNRACGITYTAYRNVFSIWALGRCRATYPEIFGNKDWLLVD